MDLAGLRALASSYLERLEQGAELDEADWVAMVRIFNTVELGGLAAGDPVLGGYRDAFWPDLVEPAMHRLDMVATKGMALYSERHDLYLGGPRDAAGSRFEVVDI